MSYYHTDPDRRRMEQWIKSLKREKVEVDDCRVCGKDFPGDPMRLWCESSECEEQYLVDWLKERRGGAGATWIGFEGDWFVQKSNWDGM